MLVLLTGLGFALLFDYLGDKPNRRSASPQSSTSRSWGGSHRTPPDHRPIAVREPSHLAVVLAQAGHRAALRNADLRRRGLQDVVGTPQEPGFTDLLLGAEASRTFNVEVCWADS